jgi:hypothetical protein
VARLGAVTTADVAWSNESAQTDEMAAAVEDTNMAWYADATRKFGPETDHGKTIRQEVPTTSMAVKPPAPPVVAKAQALGGGKVHIDFEPQASGTIEVWHQNPGETFYNLIEPKLTTDYYEHDGFPPGANSFQFVGVNSGGPGAKSAPIVIQVT